VSLLAQEKGAYVHDGKSSGKNCGVASTFHIQIDHLSSVTAKLPFQINTTSTHLNKHGWLRSVKVVFASSTREETIDLA